MAVDLTEQSHPISAFPGELEAPLAPGDLVGSYRVKREIGRGGAARVYLAVHERLRAHVALKVLERGDPEQRRRFEREGALQANLEHPGVVTVRDIIEHQGRCVLVMKHVPGRALNAVLTEGPLPEKEALRLWGEVLEAVAHVHDAGVAHRDLKPSNILVSLAGRAYVTDFGVAKLLEPPQSEPLTQCGRLLGTPSYMAPEQLRGEADVGAAADVYALGVILYEMIAGRRPYIERDPFALLTRLERRDFELIEALDDVICSQRVASLIGACMALHGDVRPSCRELLERLEELAPARAFWSDEARAPSSRQRLGPVRWFALAALIAFAAAALAVTLRSARREAARTDGARQRAELLLASRQIERVDPSAALALWRAALDGMNPSQRASHAARAWRLAQLGARAYDLEPPGGEVLTLAFSEDGQALAGGMADGRLAVWDVGSGALRFVIQTSSSHHIKRVGFTPDGRFVLAMSPQYADMEPAVFYDARRGEPAFALSDAYDCDFTLLPASREVIFSRFMRPERGARGQLALGRPESRSFEPLEVDVPGRLICDLVRASPDERQLALVAVEGFEYKRPTLYLYDLDAEQVRSAHPLPGGVNGMSASELAWSADASLLALGDRRGLSVYDVRAGELSARLEAHVTRGPHVGAGGEMIWADGARIVVAQADLSDTRTVATHRGAVLTTELDPLGVWLVAGSVDRSYSLVHLPSLTTFAPQRAGDSWIHDVAFSPGRGLLVTAGRDGRVRAWQLDTLPARLEAPPGSSSITHGAMSSSGRYAALRDELGRVWRARDDGPMKLTPIDLPGRVYAFEVDERGEIWACTTTGCQSQAPASAVIERGRLWALARQQEVFVGVADHARGEDRHVSIARQDGAAPPRVIGFGERVTRLALDDEAARLVAVTQQRTLHLLDLKRGTQQTFELGPGGEPAAVELWEDRLLLSSWEGPPLLLDLTTGEALGASERRNARGARLLAVDASHGVVALGGLDGSLEVIEAASGESRHLWDAHDLEVSALSRVLRGRYVASAGLDGSVALWDLKLGRGLARWSVDSPVTALALRERGEQMELIALDRNGKRWRWEASAASATGGVLEQTAGWTNARVCPDSTRVIHVPAALAARHPVWAPRDRCEAPP